jgi:hypothetical protein
MEAVTPASPYSLPPLGELIAGDPFWRFPSGPGSKEGVAHLRVWLTAGAGAGHLAVVTETGSADSVTGSAGYIRSDLTRWYGSSLVLLERYPGAEDEESTGTLDLARIGTGGSPRWTRIWPTPEGHPRHAGLELWMAAGGRQIVSRPAGHFDQCQDEAAG